MSKHPRAPAPKQGAKIRAPDAPPAKRAESWPSFSFRHLSAVKKYCLDACDPREKADLLSTLCKLCALTWDQITLSPRHGLGTEKITQGQIKAALPKAVTPDMSLLVLRFSNRKPMIGYRENDVFYALFLDPKFGLYGH